MKSICFFIFFFHSILAQSQNYNLEIERQAEIYALVSFFDDSEDIRISPVWSWYNVSYIKQINLNEATINGPLPEMAQIQIERDQNCNATQINFVYNGNVTNYCSLQRTGNIMNVTYPVFILNQPTRFAITFDSNNNIIEVDRQLLENGIFVSDNDYHVKFELYDTCNAYNLFRSYSFSLNSFQDFSITNTYFPDSCFLKSRHRSNSNLSDLDEWDYENQKWKYHKQTYSTFGQFPSTSCSMIEYKYNNIGALDHSGSHGCQDLYTPDWDYNFNSDGTMQSRHEIEDTFLLFTFEYENCIEASSVNDVHKSETFTLYPTISNNLLQIEIDELDKSDEHIYEIYNMKGELVKEGKINSSRAEIGIQTINLGWHTFVLKNAKNLTYKKFYKISNNF